MLFCFTLLMYHVDVLFHCLKNFKLSILLMNMVVWTHVSMKRQHVSCISDQIIATFFFRSGLMDRFTDNLHTR